MQIESYIVLSPIQMQQSGGLLLDPGWTGSTPLFLPIGQKCKSSPVVAAIRQDGVSFWYGYSGNGLEPIYMQQSGRLLLDPGWTGSTPLFLPSGKMQIESCCLHQKNDVFRRRTEPGHTTAPPAVLREPNQADRLCST